MAALPDAISDEKIFVRQTWVKKKTRHTRLLAKRYIQLRQGVLSSYKKVPWDVGAEATCTWNIKGALSTLKPIQTGGKAKWQLQVSDGPYIEASEEICFVFDSELQAERWFQYLDRASRFGSLSISFAMVSEYEVYRDLRGLDLPAFLKALPYMVSNSRHVRPIVAHTSVRMAPDETPTTVVVGYAQIPFLIYKVSLPREVFKRHSAVVFVVNVQDSESVFGFKMFQVGKLMDFISHGGTWRSLSTCTPEEKSIAITMEVPILHRIQQTDSINIKVQISTWPGTDGAGLKAMLAMSKPLTLDQVSDITIPMGCFHLYGRNGYPIQHDLSNEESVQASVRCTVPWWHVFNSVLPEETPLLQEYNYNEWITEGRKLVALFNR
eukprot:Blabericola_migrator_1__3324@NODE_197_length_11501_cov_283_066206_g170_i0_p5_GENE_NODE_197_length_11501_cov_283_066206_g170_i0NODE_197_length_11501_cov_283_066206_g170_i0_p5_ORF_typecomplete_len380_score64_42PH/PF00169_29/0_0062_NODE_197_length_11501_cov_283_066206_g170_i047355874